MAIRTVTRVLVSAGTTAVTFAEGDLEVSTFIVVGSLVDSSDNTLALLNPETDYTLKTVGGFSVTTTVSGYFSAIVASTGTAEDDADLNANAIVTLSQVKAFLGISASDTTYDALLRTQINQVSDALELFCNCKIALQDVTDVVDGNGRSRMLTASRPIAQIGNDTPTSSPLASDGFSTTTTDGLGHTQSEFVGTGGDAKVWVVRVNAFGRAGGKAMAGVDDTNLETLDAGESDVIVKANVTIPEPGSVGLILRYVDTSNYLIARHNKTSIILDKVLAGVTTNLLTETATYSAGAEIKVVCSGAKLRVYYGGTQYGSDVYCQNFLTSTLFGIYATAEDGTNYVDNFVVYPLSLIQVRDDPTEAWEDFDVENSAITFNKQYPFYLEVFDDVFPHGSQNVKTPLKAGYATIPGLFTTVALEEISTAYYKSQPGGNVLLLNGSQSFSQTGGSISSSGGGLSSFESLSTSHRNQLINAGLVYRRDMHLDPFRQSMSFETVLVKK